MLESIHTTGRICDAIHYKNLNDSTRNFEYFGNDGYTDNSESYLDATISPDWNGPGWYRMVEPAGTKVSKSSSYSM